MLCTIADFLPIEQISPYTYSIGFEKEWNIGAVVNGGYVISAMMITAKVHMEKKYPKLSQSDVMNLHMELLRKTSSGPAVITVKETKIGRMISNLHLTVSQHKDMSDSQSPMQDEVEGYITITSMAHEKGPTAPTKYRLHPKPLPVSLEALSTNKDKNYILRRRDVHADLRPYAQNLKMHLVKPSARTSDYSPALVDQWTQFSPLKSTNTTSRWTNDSLGYLVDVFPQIYDNYIDGHLTDIVLSYPEEHSDAEVQTSFQTAKKNGWTAKYWYPTLLLNLDVKMKLPDEGVEWLFMRTQAKKIQNGRMDYTVEVWTDPLEGELVALSSQAVLMLDVSRNLTKTKDSKM